MLEVMPKKESEERKLLHDIKVFVASFLDHGNISVMKVMKELSGSKSRQLEDLINRLEKY